MPTAVPIDPPPAEIQQATTCALDISDARAPQEHHSRFCPTCSSRLEDHRCKLICRNCGYFLSCADFY